MRLDSEEEKFLRDLINYTISTSEDWRKTLTEAAIPLNGRFEETYPESFGPYSRDEEEIIQDLFDRNILKIKVQGREVHQSLEENSKSKKKDVTRGLGIEEEKLDELVEELDIEP